MPPETEQIERTYRAAFTVYQTGNVRAITPYYDMPALFLTSSGPRAVANTREAEQYFERVIYSARTRFARAVITSVEVKLVAEDLAMVHARGERYSREGELVERTSVLCAMRKAEGTWRIVTTTECDPERPLELR